MEDACARGRSATASATVAHQLAARADGIGHRRPRSAGQAAALDIAPSRRSAGRRARRLRRSARCSDDRGWPPPRPRRGTAARPSARGQLPAEDHLQGDDPVEAHLPGLVDDAHAAAGDLFAAARSPQTTAAGRRPESFARPTAATSPHWPFRRPSAATFPDCLGERSSARHQGITPAGC